MSRYHPSSLCCAWGIPSGLPATDCDCRARDKNREPTGNVAKCNHVPKGAAAYRMHGRGAKRSVATIHLWMDGLGGFRKSSFASYDPKFIESKLNNGVSAIGIRLLKYGQDILNNKFGLIGDSSLPPPLCFHLHLTMSKTRTSQHLKVPSKFAMISFMATMLTKIPCRSATLGVCTASS